MVWFNSSHSVDMQNPLTK